MAFPRTPSLLRYGPSGSEGAQVVGVKVEDVYQGAVAVAGGVFNFLTGVAAGLQAGAAKPAGGPESRKKDEQHRQGDISQGDGSFSDLRNDVNEQQYDQKEHERLVQQALAAFRKAEARGDTDAEITEAEYAAWKRQVAIEAKLRREEEEKLKREKEEAGKRKITVPIPSSFGAPGIFVPGQGFTPVGGGSTPGSAPRSGSSTPARFPDANYSEPAFARSVPDVSSSAPKAMDSGKSSSSYLSFPGGGTTRRPAREGAVSSDDLPAPRNRSPGGSSVAERRNVWEGR